MEMICYRMVIHPYNAFMEEDDRHITDILQRR